MIGANQWFNRAMAYRDRGDRQKAIHALMMGRQCARAACDRELEHAFSTAISLIAV
jgi:hypothetical protein